jgi:hypothetical protein
MSMVSDVNEKTHDGGGQPLLTNTSDLFERSHVECLNPRRTLADGRVQLPRRGFTRPLVCESIWT